MRIDEIGGRAAFLDRDGVLNRAIVRHGRPYAPVSLEEMEILPGVREALDRLKAAGYRLVVVTNQPDVARGLQRRETVEAINAALMARLPLDEVRVCYHDDADGCTCRKPEPGLLMQQPAHHLSRSVMIGDRWRDIEAGRRALVRATVFIDYGYEERQVEPDVRVGSLSLAVDWILKLPENGP
jgi:D-glycero-D-manno-heptose 1,7-bisphosphate phosphatase